MCQAFTMSRLKKLSNKKLITLLHESDDMTFVEEISRRIKLGLIPLAIIGFSKLSNKKLRRIITLSECDWALEEICKRMDEGKIPKRVVTLEEIKELYSKNKQAS